ncbi:MAG: B12-binding domain-containing radical SAM protein [Chloroflexi bacterium]|nr:B12-binding domain-containing radical SAM protein [Chloroflexota bacterium]
MKVLLVFPYFHPAGDRSIFRFPPLGLGYLAAWLRQKGHDVDILDCTFLDRKIALEKARRSASQVVGIYCAFPLQEDCLQFARSLRDKCDLLIAGGPLPSGDPLPFAGDFDVVVKGEGEHTVEEVVAAYEGKRSLESVRGIAYRRPGENAANGMMVTPSREMEPVLDSLPFPARDLLPNEEYQYYGRKRYGKATTSVLTTRGCPFSCEFCSNAVFGNSFRERSAANIVDEVESVLRLGYDRIHFADDVFTLRKARVLEVCEEIRARKLRFTWECLCRVDLIDTEMASAMKAAGCDRIFFGIESASPGVLKIIKKNFTVERAQQAVVTAKRAGLRTGAFFILCYPGDNDDSVLETIRFSTALPLDYLSFTLPYPLPGTALYERVKDRLKTSYKAHGNIVTEHFLTFDGDFSETKMRFAILKGKLQFALRKRLDGKGESLVHGIERATDRMFRMMK